VTILTQQRAEGPAVAITLAALAFALFSVADVFAKTLTARHPVVQITFLNASFAVLPISLACHLRGGFGQLTRGGVTIPILRAVSSLAAGLCGLFALSRMPMADAYALAFTAPLFITALSRPILGEAVGWRRWSAVIVGFIGVLVMLRPGRGNLDIGALSALAGAFFYSVGMLLVRSQRARISGFTFAFFSVTTASVLTGALMPAYWTAMPPADFARAAACGLAGGSALLMLLTAFGRAPAAIVSPFQYSQMVWGVLWGLLVFHDRPDMGLLTGGAIVIASGLFILHRETRLGRPPSLPMAPERS
jgi:drug/metabolite transporter (DMT)-like permease